MAELSREYLERRYRESLKSAQQATDPSIARVHREFARQYAAAMVEGQPPVRVHTQAQ